MSIESVIKPKITYKAKALPYEYNALEPIITKSTLEKLYSNYEECVNYLNNAQYTFTQAYENLENYEHFNYWVEEIAKGEFLFSLYTTYFSLMSPLGLGGIPGRKTRERAKKSLFSFARLKEHFINAGVDVNSSGWVVLMYLPEVGRFKIFQVEEGKYYGNSIIPILPCYVQDETTYSDLLYGRRQFIEKWWRLINWYEVEKNVIQADRGF